MVSESIQPSFKFQCEVSMHINWIEPVVEPDHYNQRQRTGIISEDGEEVRSGSTHDSRTAEITLTVEYEYIERLLVEGRAANLTNLWARTLMQVQTSGLVIVATTIAKT